MISFLTNLFSKAAASPIEAFGNVFDKLFTSDEEKANAAIVLEKLRQHPAELQVEINKIEASHRSIFVAGWRPFIGWICGISLGYTFVANPLIQWITGKGGPVLASQFLMDIVIALLGLGALRTVEKLGGRTK